MIEFELKQEKALQKHEQDKKDIQNERDSLRTELEALKQGHKDADRGL